MDIDFRWNLVTSFSKAKKDSFSEEFYRVTVCEFILKHYSDVDKVHVFGKNELLPVLDKKK